MFSFDAVEILENSAMVDYVEDWSRVRSPARARRRRKLGFKQNIRTFIVPKREVISIHGGRTLVMHPEIAKRLREQTKELELRSNALFDIARN